MGQPTTRTQRSSCTPRTSDSAAGQGQHSLRGVNVLMRHAGLTADDLDEVILAGAFGSYIDPAGAIAIGLVPDVGPEAIRAVGNAAGHGARMCLLSLTGAGAGHGLAGAGVLCGTVGGPGLPGRIRIRHGLSGAVVTGRLSAPYTAPLESHRPAARGIASGSRGDGMRRVAHGSASRHSDGGRPIASGSTNNAVRCANGHSAADGGRAAAAADVNLRAGGPIGRVTATPTASPVITAPPDFAPPPAAPGAAATPVSIQADLERALELLQGGDLEEARKVFEAAAEAVPDDPRPLMGMALADQFAGDLEGALAEATRAVELAPEFLPALITRADIHLALGNAAAAAEDYTAAIRIEPLNATAHLGHGRSLAAQGDLAGAVDALTRAIDIAGNNPAYLIERARLYLAMETIDAAISDLEQAKAASPDDPRPALVLALTLQGNGELDRALAEATYAVEIAPEFLPALFTRGDIRLALGDAMGAAEDYGAAARIDPLNPLAHAGQAQALRAQGDVAGAIEALTRALDIAGDSPDYLAERARLHLDLQNVEPALADLERAVAAAPERVGIRLLYADVLRFAERLDDALAVVSALIEDEPGLPLAYELRASIRMSLGDEPGALEDLAAAIEIDPSDASAYARAPCCTTRPSATRRRLPTTTGRWNYGALTR